MTAVAEAVALAVSSEVRASISVRSLKPLSREQASEGAASLALAMEPQAEQQASVATCAGLVAISNVPFRGDLV